MAASSEASTTAETIFFQQRRLTWKGATRGSPNGNVEALRLKTDQGVIVGRYHPAPGSSASERFGVVWVGGAGGGLDGPAGALYPEACERLQMAGIAGLRLHYRKPNVLEDCVLDTLTGVAFLAREGITKVALVGHSFGGAVVISAAANSPHVQAVVPMSSQTAGTALAPLIAPRPILLIHGTADDILSPLCSQQIYAMAGNPKQMKLYPGVGHGLDGARQEILDLLIRWIPESFARTTSRADLGQLPAGLTPPL